MAGNGKARNGAATFGAGRDYRIDHRARVGHIGCLVISNRRQVAHARVHRGKRDPHDPKVGFSLGDNVDGDSRF